MISAQQKKTEREREREREKNVISMISAIATFVHFSILFKKGEKIRQPGNKTKSEH